MSEQVRYVTNENGEQIGVLLNLQEYKALKAQVVESPDSELLIGISEAELRALADSILAPAAQQRLNDLLSVNTDGNLSSEESEELDNLLAQVDHLTVLKARARYTLQKRASLPLAA